MTIHVTIGEAETRLAELVAAALRGEEVVLGGAGGPEVRLMPMAAASSISREELIERRKRAIGMWKDAMAGVDTSLAALRQDRPDPEERFERKFGPAA